MDKQHVGWRYLSVPIEDRKEGWVGLSLRRIKKSDDELAAKIIFWDAVGEFSLELSVSELPLPIVEEFIREARELITIK